MNKMVPVEVRNRMNNEEIVLTSIDLVNKINEFRAEEGKEKLKRHDVLMRDIRNEIETLKSLKELGVASVHNFVEGVLHR